MSDGSLSLNPRSDRSAPVLVLGGFDGCHLGHRQLLHGAVEVARRERRRVITVVMDDAASPVRLSTVQDRCRMALGAGSSAVHVVNIDSRHGSLATAAVMDDVDARFRPAYIVMACLPVDESDARYPSMRDEIRRRGTTLIEIERWVDADRQPVSSRGIAAALSAGDVAKARAQLGRPYTIDGVVVHGSGLGHTIGFPTANLDPPASRVLPAKGVYAATVTLDDRSVHRAAVNIGVRPTVEDHGALLVEAHLLGFDADIYDQEIRIAFRLWLRAEQRFGSLDELVAQLGRDAVRAGLALD